MNLAGLAARWGDGVAGALERSQALDRLGQALTSLFARFVRPGQLKDLLAGTWLGHPLHPVLTDVPIGAWTGAMAFDVFGGQRSHGASDSLIGLGVLTALPTAVTGLSELADTVDRRERSLAAAHAAGNIAAVILYSGSYLARRRGSRKAGAALSTAGWAAVLGSGFLGGHLAFARGSASTGPSSNRMARSGPRRCPTTRCGKEGSPKPRLPERTSSSTGTRTVSTR